MKHDGKTRYEAVQLARQGAALLEVQGLLKASHETVRRWCSSEGISLLVGCGGGSIVAKGDRASAKLARLGLAQRPAIASGLAASSAHEQVARGIGLSRPTASREAARHRGRDGAHGPYAAQVRAERDAAHPKARKLDASRRLRACVAAKLALRWSPAQVSALLARELPDDEEMRASPGGICRAPCAQGKGALR